ncbi:MAG: DUF4397 domain-containing protein [Bacteroidetes bacterium]|jgi:hypothetical protein|nr:DUF4397 domain-containing protein [Bacteroidota bacterium]
MKLYGNPLNRWTALLGIGCFLLLLTSCLKSKNDYTPPPVGYVTFFQAAPDQQPVDLYFNSNKVNQAPLNYGDGIDYFQVYPGLRTVNINNSNSNTLLFSDTARISPNIAYSLFLIENTTQQLGLFLLTDSISKPATGKAILRFINVSPDAPAVDLALKDSTAFVTNKGFKGFSSFIPKTGGQTYNFEIRQHGTNTVLATLSGVTLSSGLVYTIWLHGLANTAIAGDKLTASIVTNAYYSN